MTKETCHLCLKQLSEDEIDLCDDCFENMEMEVWVSSNKIFGNIDSLSLKESEK